VQNGSPSAICSQGVVVGSTGGKRHANDICTEIDKSWIGGDLWITMECIDVETGEVYRYTIIFTFSNWPGNVSGGIRIPDPNKVGAALGLSGIVAWIVGGIIEGAGSLAGA
jgi:hypothetical protein